MQYFAYGSNLDRMQMDSRCPDNEYKGRARLAGYRFTFDGFSKGRNGAVANIIESPQDEVWGCLYDISEADKKKLDGFESVAQEIYGIIQVTVTDDSGALVPALAYTRTNEKEGTPAREYYDQVLQGMVDCDLPVDYRQRIRNAYRPL